MKMQNQQTDKSQMSKSRSTQPQKPRDGGQTGTKPKQKNQDLVPAVTPPPADGGLKQKPEAAAGPDLDPDLDPDLPRPDPDPDLPRPEQVPLDLQKSRTKQTRKPRDGGQTGTKPKQKNQDLVPAVTPPPADGGLRQKPKATADPDLDPDPDPDLPRPEQVPLDLQKSRTKQTRKPRDGGQTGTKPKQKNQDPVPAVTPPPADGGLRQKPKAAADPDLNPDLDPDLPRPDLDPDLPRPDPDPDLPRPEQVPLDLGVKMDKCVVEKVEVLTRGQRTNPNWFSWRKNRITASAAHRIAHCHFVNGGRKGPPLSYLDAITGEGRNFQTRAMSWGVEKEAEAGRRYQELKTAALGRSVSVQGCGLFIDPQRPWLAASPDGIVKDDETGQWLLCLEVKCPYKHKDRRVKDACREDRAFCLEIQDEDGEDEDGENETPPVYRLKTSHSYFTQIQCQLAVTGLQRADLVVFTLKETAIVPVNFDPDLWEDTVSKLEMFYRDAFLPHVRDKNKLDVAGWMPEL